MRKYGRIGASYTDDLGRRLEALEYVPKSLSKPLLSRVQVIHMYRVNYVQLPLALTMAASSSIYVVVSPNDMNAYPLSPFT